MSATLARTGSTGRGAGLDAGHVQQVADDLAHAVGLVADDPVELAHLGGVQVRLQQRVGGALDGGQRGPQLVAHHGQELRPQPLLLLQRRQVLEGHYIGGYPALLRGDGRGVEEDGDAPAVRRPKDDLLGAHRLPLAQRLGQAELLKRDLPPVGAAEGQQVQKLLRGLAFVPQAFDDARRLPVQGDRRPRLGVEDHDAHRRGVHQDLQVGPGPPLLPVPAGVGDDHRRLGGEHHQRLLVILAELRAGLLPGQVDAGHAPAQVPDGGCQEGAYRHRQARLGQPLRCKVARQVGQPERLGNPAQALEEPRRFGHPPQPLRLLGRQPGGEQGLRLSFVVQQDDGPVARLCQVAGRVQDALQHGVEVQALVDAHARLALPGEPLPQGRYLLVPPVCLAHLLLSWLTSGFGPFCGSRGHSTAFGVIFTISFTEKGWLFTCMLYQVTILGWVIVPAGRSFSLTHHTNTH